MTIEEAIQHCRDEAEKNRARANAYDNGGQSMLAEGFNACATEHAQLAAWLIELQEKRCKVIVQANRIEEMKAEVQEPAHWLQRKQNGYAVLVCSACEKQKEGNARTAYCPNCGRPITNDKGGKEQ